MSRRLFTACLGTETNSYSPVPTGLGLFEKTMLVRAGEHGEKPTLFALPLIIWRERAQQLGWVVKEGLAAFAVPAGDTTQQAYETLRDEILDNLKAAMPVDAVLLNLHGAMIADGFPDAEGDLLKCVREMIGPDIPLVAELDLHGHMTDLKEAAADALVYFKLYPHTDVRERAHEAFEILEGMLSGEIKPTMAVHDCKMLGIYPTTREPLISFVARMQALEQEEKVLSVSLVHGFPWGNTPEVGTRVLVVTNDEPALAKKMAAELGEWVWQNRDDLLAPFISVDQAMQQIAAHGHEGAPIVLADTADNTGIGAGGDSTFLLAELISRGIGGVAISPLFDPVATEFAFDAGVGARISMRIGGKLGPASGDPVDALFTVMGLRRGAEQPFGGSIAPVGDVAWLRYGGPDDADAIDVVINTVRVQGFDPACFSQAGIDPVKPRALIVKSTQHFYTGFEPLAASVSYIASPGSGSMDFAALEHSRVSARLWPKVANPHQDD